MSNLKKVFANKKAFIPFVVADDPDVDTTVVSVLTLAQNGADIVELGIPFSDPVADGPVIQKADLRAFEAGVSTKVVFEIVEKIRQSSSVPIVFLTYLNIPFKYGYDKFCQRCQELGVAGLVIPDAPIEEQGELRPFAEKYGIDLIPLIAPTSDNRIEKIAQSATGFIYVIGAIEIRDEVAIQKLNEIIKRIKKVADVPVVIESSGKVAKLTTIADGIIINSAVVQIIANGGDVQKNLSEYAQSIKDSMRIKV